jgi:hypothetical protein
LFAKFFHLVFRDSRAVLHFDPRAHEFSVLKLSNVRIVLYGYMTIITCLLIGDTTDVNFGNVFVFVQNFFNFSRENIFTATNNDVLINRSKLIWS